MRLSVVRPPYIIPSYSLTGDLLAYLKCGLQYRYHSKGALPPSKPVQLWFGEFIHGVLEEAFLVWSRNPGAKPFPWNWLQDIRPIELEIYRRLRARGLFPPFRLFCAYDGPGTRCTCPDPAPPSHQLLASRRTEGMVSVWAPHLFPLITESEVNLQSIRPMPTSGSPRAAHYEVTGVVDVIGSVQLRSASTSNLILAYLQDTPEVGTLLQQYAGSSFEIVVDYKGMRRPASTSLAWDHYYWQVLTYAWLRAQQAGSSPVVAGILLFVNELVPSQEDIGELQDDVHHQATDVMPTATDLQSITGWRPGSPVPPLSPQLLVRRSIRIVTVDQAAIAQSLQQFDAVVADIESSVLQEMTGQGVRLAWQGRPSGQTYIAPEKRTCTACDFKHYCPLSPRVGEGGPPSAP